MQCAHTESCLPRVTTLVDRQYSFKSVPLRLTPTVSCEKDVQWQLNWLHRYTLRWQVIVVRNVLLYGDTFSAGDNIIVGCSNGRLAW